jgi:hypothetical protein
MILVGIFSALLLLAYGASEYTSSYEIAGFQVSLLFVAIAPMMTVRDMIHQKHSRHYLLLTMIVTFIIVYWWLGEHYALAVAGALIWTELADFFLFTYFRRYGWFIGVVVSDLLTLPLPIILVFGLQYDVWSWPTRNLLVEVLTLVPIYVILYYVESASALFPGLAKVDLRLQGEAA